MSQLGITLYLLLVSSQYSGAKIIVNMMDSEFGQKTECILINTEFQRRYRILFIYLFWFFTSQSTIFQSYQDGHPGLNQCQAENKVSCSGYKFIKQWKREQWGLKFPEEQFKNSSKGPLEVKHYLLLQAISSSNNGSGNNGGFSSRKNSLRTPAAELIFSQASSSSHNGSSPKSSKINEKFWQWRMEYV